MAAVALLIVIVLAIFYQAIYAENFHTLLLKTKRREPEMTLRPKMQCACCP